ncbi:hypothetical protein IscW_ISCW007654 [Ixodes scapularis]|uniref:Uncharacterized protein n=1 Tax=Ixodes scapularis TaxID=6945 RepID=B7PW98_IXOSC|nr:hypothetical protein IscW_ISCW007654 [Ixodes scapularis]|eukprot:XP_002409532.1 hypothetical protein IscW_ISCW007654 [Ixodes scapularis]
MGDRQQRRPFKVSSHQPGEQQQHPGVLGEGLPQAAFSSCLSSRSSDCSEETMPKAIQRSNCEHSLPKDIDRADCRRTWAPQPHLEPQRRPINTQGEDGRRCNAAKLAKTRELPPDHSSDHDWEDDHDLSRGTVPHIDIQEIGQNMFWQHLDHLWNLVLLRWRLQRRISLWCQILQLPQRVPLVILDKA